MKRNKFLKFPEYPGGKDEYRNYIQKNLRYPKDALEKRIQGIVHLTAEIDDNGLVSDARIEKGLGYGCDEEALRLVKELKYGGVKNPGLRIKTRKRFRIQFILKEIENNKSDENKIHYQIKTNPPVIQNKMPEVKYSYSVTINQPEQ